MRRKIEHSSGIIPRVIPELSDSALCGAVAFGPQYFWMIRPLALKISKAGSPDHSGIYRIVEGSLHYERERGPRMTRVFDKVLSSRAWTNLTDPPGVQVILGE